MSGQPFPPPEVHRRGRISSGSRPLASPWARTENRRPIGPRLSRDTLRCGSSWRPGYRPPTATPPRAEAVVRREAGAARLQPPRPRRPECLRLACRRHGMKSPQVTREGLQPGPMTGIFVVGRAHAAISARPLRSPAATPSPPSTKRGGRGLEYVPPAKFFPAPRRSAARAAFWKRGAPGAEMVLKTPHGLTSETFLTRSR